MEILDEYGVELIHMPLTHIKSYIARLADSHELPG
jgi:hypothetical protein